METVDKKVTKPLSAAERQRRRRDKLKKQGTYTDYRAKEAAYSRKYRENLVKKVEVMEHQEQTQFLEEKRKKNRLRKQRHRARHTTKRLCQTSSHCKAVKITQRTLSSNQEKGSSFQTSLTEEFEEYEGSTADIDPLGKWYAVYWQPSDNWFLGRAIRIDSNDEVTVKFVHQTAENSKFFNPTNDVAVVAMSDLLVNVKAPMSVSSSKCSPLRLADEDYANIKDSFEKFKKGNYLEKPKS